MMKVIVLVQMMKMNFNNPLYPHKNEGSGTFLGVCIFEVFFTFSKKVVKKR